MNPRNCPRCHAVLHREDEGSLVYCWNCGTPQVRLSEDLRMQAEQQQAAAQPEAIASATETVDSSAVNWKNLIRIAAAVSGFFSLLASSILLVPIALLAPPVTLALYGARFRQSRITTGLGARVGLLCGLFLAMGISFFGTIGLVVSRYGTQQMGKFDSSLATYMASPNYQAVAQPGTAMAAALTIPDFRIGILFVGFVMLLAMIVLLCAASGAFAGFVRSRTRQR